MRRICRYTLSIAACLLYTFLLKAEQQITDYVNPFIGTGAIEGGLSGNNYPGATIPFGMVQLSPDTQEVPDWDKASGYDYNDREIYGFSHTRLSGTGASDLIDLLVMPVAESFDKVIPENYKSSFSHKHESARPGYYSVLLERGGIQAELAATARVGVHRYTFPNGKDAHVVIDLDHSANKGSWNRRIINSQLRMTDAYTLEGYRIITGWAKLRKVCFSISFSHPVASYYMQDYDRKHENTPVINGSCLRAMLDFNLPQGEALVAKVALSPISVENARENLKAEAAFFSFDEIAQKADAAWNKELSKIEIEGSDLQKEIFYTSFYHTLIQPNLFSDVNGEYISPDYTVRRLPNGEENYTTFSLWDTYRAAHPLYTLIQPERNAAFVNSMIRHYRDYGYLPIWHLWGQDNYCMIGNHAIPVVVDAVLKGLPEINAEEAYEAVLKSSLISHPNSPFEVWEQYGYMPENIQSQSVSITLEFAFDDWCVAQLAKHLGKTDDYERFMKRSAFYRNLHDGNTGFFRAKDDKGEWIEPFDPYGYGANGGHPFTEGNAWQYYWYVPHNVPDLIELTGGRKAFVNKLDEFFTSTRRSGELNDNASGFVGQYAHGNEPSHHVAYLYNYAGEPWKTQKYVAHILQTLYNNTSSGYAGNDDCGEMSAWYVFSAMGFYPVNPAGGEYAIGTPLLEKAVIRLLNNKTFTIEAPKRDADKDIYIQSATLNGKPYTKNYITHSDIVAGGTLRFKMGSKPSKWGKGN